MQGQGDSLTTTGVARPILSGRFSAIQRVKLPRTCQAHAHQKSGSDLCDRRFCDGDGLLRNRSDGTDGSEAEQVLRRRQKVIKFIPPRHEEAQRSSPAATRSRQASSACVARTTGPGPGAERRCRSLSNVWRGVHRPLAISQLSCSFVSEPRSGEFNAPDRPPLI